MRLKRKTHQILNDHSISLNISDHIVSVDGKINLEVCYGSKPLEFAKGKNAIELASEDEVADTPHKVRDAAELGELHTSCTRTMRRR